jgi:hypothetical protein
MLVFSTYSFVNYCPSNLLFGSPIPHPSPFPKDKVQYIQTVSGWEGVVVLSCVGDHILQEFNTMFLTRFRTHKIALPPQTNLGGKGEGGLRQIGIVLYIKNRSRIIEKITLLLSLLVRVGVHAYPLSAYYHHIQSCSVRSC